MSTPDEAQSIDQMLDIPPEFRGVVVKHGRGLWALVMNAQMGAHAAGVLVELARKHSSRGGVHAIGVLANAFNQTTQELCVAKGWTAEAIAECDRDCRAAMAGKLAVPESKIVLLN